jgi:large subunit ribosomal protein L13
LRRSSPCVCAASTADYTPNVDCGDYVVVVNADKVKFTGKKLTDKIYYRHTGHPGGVKSTTPQKVLNGRFPERVLEKAVERMLPKESPLARAQMTHLRLFSGRNHTHEAQKPGNDRLQVDVAKNTRSL